MPILRIEEGSLWFKLASPLQFDVTSALLSSNNRAIEYFTKRDLLKENVEPISWVWGLPEVEKMFRSQQADGSVEAHGRSYS